MFVKPTRGGSSYGVSKVADASEMAHALEVAFALDPKVSVEEAIEGTEVGCAITGDASGKLEMGVVDETVVTDGGFFHIHQDQTAGAAASSKNSSLRCPAQTPPTTRWPACARRASRCIARCAARASRAWTCS